MIETLAENDDGLAEKYLAGEDISIAEIMAALRSATISLKIVPVLCGAALRIRAFKPILDAGNQLSTITGRYPADKRD